MLFLYRDVSRKQHRTFTLKKLTLKWLLILTLFNTLISNVAYADKLYLFNIPQQSADQAIINFAQKTNRTIVFSYELTKQYQVQPLNGYFSFSHALAKLLRGTELKAKISDNGEVKIYKSAPTSNGAIESLAIANNDAPLAIDSAEKSVEKIAIVGSRDIARSIHELAVPVDILSATSLQNTGQVEMGRMIQTIAPSFNFASSSISDGTDVLKPATLRGLGPDQTLILVNGKRRHHASLLHINTSVGRGTAGADLNAFPVQAIKRVEILRDGAAAQYGSDAIAGVINIVLKDDPSTGTVTTSYGGYSYGDGKTSSFSVNKGFGLNDNGFFNTTLSIQDHQATNRSGLHGSCQYTNCEKLDNGNYQTTNDKEISADRNTFKIGDPAYHQLGLSYNASYPVADGEWYSFAIFTTRENDSAAFFRQSNNSAANPVLQDNIPLMPDGYLPYIHSDITDKSWSIGYRTEVAVDTTIDMSYTYGKNTIDYITKNSVNASYADMLRYQKQLTAEEIRTQTPHSADAYGLSLSLQTLNIDFQRMFDMFTITAGVEFRQDDYQVSAGEKYSYFDYNSLLEPPLLSGSSLGGIQGFPGIKPKATVNEQRNISSVYLEVSTELTEKFSINSALRYDNYQDFGDTSNIKLAMNWQISDVFKLRSSLSTGFRAPSMQQLYFNNVSTQFLVDDQNLLVAEQVGTYRNDSLVANAIGIPRLKEEQSTNFSIGSVFEFNDSFNVTVDYYNIEINDRIMISNKLSPNHFPSVQQLLLNSEIDKIQLFLNGADTNTHGIDIISTWQPKISSGALNVTFAANFTSTEVSKLFSPHSSELNNFPIEKVFSTQDVSIINEWQPKNRISLNTLYRNNNWSLNFALNRYGEYTITDGETQTYSPKVLADIRFEQSVSKKITWFAGVNNLFNTTPDENNIGNSHGGTIVDGDGNVVVSSPGVFKYSRRSAPFGFNGSYGYIGIDFHF